jgi:hypothetical protein
MRADPGSRNIDIAAVSGALTLPAAKAGAMVTAIDIAPCMAARASRTTLCRSKRRKSMCRGLADTAGGRPVRAYGTSAEDGICGARSASDT